MLPARTRILRRAPVLKAYEVVIGKPLMKMRDRLNKVVVAPSLLLLVGCSARRVDLTRKPAS